MRIRMLAYLSAAICVIVAAMGAAWWLMQPCRPLDQIVGQSRCSGSITIKSFLPVQGNAASPLAEDGLTTIFGRDYEDGRPVIPMMVRADFDRRDIAERIALPFLSGIENWWPAFADDGSTARISAYVLDSAEAREWWTYTSMNYRTGAVIETGLAETLPRDPLSLNPPSPVADSARLARSILPAAQGGRKIVVWDTGQIELFDEDDTAIAQLSDGEDFYRGAFDHIQAISVSPSGNRIAALFASSIAGPRQLRIFDADDGAIYAELELSLPYSISHAPIWPNGDDTIALIRVIEHDLDAFRIPARADTAIDIYRLR